MSKIVVDKTSLGTPVGQAGSAVSVTMVTNVAIAAKATVVVGVNWYHTSNTCTGVTVDGNACFPIKSGKNGSFGVSLWGYYSAAGLASGKNIVATFTNASTLVRTIGAMSLFNVDTTTPVTTSTGPTNGAVAAWATPSTAVALGGVFVAQAMKDGFAVSSNTPAASIAECYDLSTDDCGNTLSYRLVTAAGNVTVGGTWNTADTNVNVGGVLAPLASAVVFRNGILGGTNSTANTTAYTSGTINSAGWAAGDFIVVFVASTGCTDPAPTLVASANGITFTLVGTAVKTSSGDTLYAFVADQLVPSSPLGMNFTFNCTGATGVIISVAIATGMQRSGLAAVRQFAKVDNVASGVAPSTVFAASALAADPTLIGILTTTAAGSTPPPGWFEEVDATYGGPTTGGGYASRDAGFDGTTITYASTANGDCCAFAMEFDITAPPSASEFEGWGVAV